MDTDLSFIDEQTVFVAAPPPVVWRVLTERIIKTRLGIREPFARLLGAEPQRVSGTPLDQGSTLPGFAVAEVVPEDHLILTGSHRFSRYALVFALARQPSGTTVSARAHAVFPGPAGWGYRHLVIGSGAHRILVRRLVRSIGREAERQSAS